MRSRPRPRSSGACRGCASRSRSTTPGRCRAPAKSRRSRRRPKACSTMLQGAADQQRRRLCVDRSVQPDVNVGASNYNANWIDWTDWEARPPMERRVRPGAPGPLPIQQLATKGSDAPEARPTNPTATPAATIGLREHHPVQRHLCGVHLPEPGQRQRQPARRAGIYYNGCYDSVPKPSRTGTSSTPAGTPAAAARRTAHAPAAAATRSASRRPTTTIGSRTRAAPGTAASTIAAHPRPPARRPAMTRRSMLPSWATPPRCSRPSSTTSARRR